MAVVGGDLITLKLRHHKHLRLVQQSSRAGRALGSLATLSVYVKPPSSHSGTPSINVFPVNSYMNRRPLGDLCFIIYYALYAIHVYDAFWEKEELVHVIMGLLL